MKVGVNFNLNVKEIDKARLYQGAKGTYLSFSTFIDIDNKDQYDNNGMVTQDVSKEEKDQGVRGNILGNCKVFWTDGNQQQAPQQQRPQQQQAPQQRQHQPQHAQQQAPNQMPAYQPQQAPQQQQYPDVAAFDDDVPF